MAHSSSSIAQPWERRRSPVRRHRPSRRRSTNGAWCLNRPPLSRRQMPHQTGVSRMSWWTPMSTSLPTPRWTSGFSMEPTTYMTALPRIRSAMSRTMVWSRRSRETSRSHRLTPESNTLTVNSVMCGATASRSSFGSRVSVLAGCSSVTVIDLPFWGVVAVLCGATRPGCSTCPGWGAGVGVQGCHEAGRVTGRRFTVGCARGPSRGRRIPSSGPTVGDPPSARPWNCTELHGSWRVQVMTGMCS